MAEHSPQLDEILDTLKKCAAALRDAGIPFMVGGGIAAWARGGPESVKDLDLVVKYQVPDISDTNQTFQDNMTVIKGIVAKYPELRDAFAAVVARAVNPAGQDYGSLLPMSQIK